MNSPSSSSDYVGVCVWGGVPFPPPKPSASTWGVPHPGTVITTNRHSYRPRGQMLPDTRPVTLTFWWICAAGTFNPI